MCSSLSRFFFYNDTATTEIYTLSLHDALPISPAWTNVTTLAVRFEPLAPPRPFRPLRTASVVDRKSTRLNSSHQIISYAVFCLKKKHERTEIRRRTSRPPTHSLPRSHRL